MDTQENPQIEKITKTKLIYNTIHSRILEGQLKPGDHLVIRSIANEFNVSDIPIREALIELAKDGLVINRPHSGTKVAEFSYNDALNIMDMREVLEPLASKLCALNIDSEGIAKLQDCYARLNLLFKNQENDEYAIVNREFHSIINSYTNNPLLTSTLDRLYNMEHWMMMMFNISAGIIEISHKEHDLLLYYLSTKKSESAEKLTYIHKNRYFNEVRSYCSKNQDLFD